MPIYAYIIYVLLTLIVLAIAARILGWGRGRKPQRVEYLLVMNPDEWIPLHEVQMRMLRREEKRLNFVHFKRDINHLLHFHQIKRTPRTRTLEEIAQGMPQTYNYCITHVGRHVAEIELATKQSLKIAHAPQ